MERDKQATLPNISAESWSKLCGSCNKLTKENNGCAIKDPEAQNERLANKHCAWHRRGGLFY